MRKAVVLLVLGMVLVGMAPTAMSEGYEHGDIQNEGSDGDHVAGTNGPGSDGSPYTENSENGGKPDTNGQ